MWKMGSSKRLWRPIPTITLLLGEVDHILQKLMMDTLQDNSSEAATYLIKKVKNLKATDFDGKNIMMMVSLLCGALKHLKQFKNREGKSALSDNFGFIVLDILQTTVILDFNRTFKHLAKQYKVTTFTLEKKAFLDCKELPAFAEKEY